MAKVRTIGVLTMVLVYAGDGAMMNVDQPPSSNDSPSIPDFLTEKELEGLLHFAIRHSDGGKLREMAESGKNLDDLRQDTAAVIEAMYATDELFKTTVQHALIDNDIENEKDLLTALEFIEDYGDHLLDKGDLLNGLGALVSLVDRVVSGGNVSVLVHSKLADLIVSITQNRDETKKLIKNIRPNFLGNIFQIIQDNCMGDTWDDTLCSSLVSVITSMIGGEEISSQTDTEIFVPLASWISKLHETSTFSRLLTLFRVVSLPLTSEVADAKWKKVIDKSHLSALIEDASVSFQLKRKIFDLLVRLGDGNVHIKMHEKCPISRPDSACDEFINLDRDEL